jgi:hypothetical protein
LRFAELPGRDRDWLRAQIVLAAARGWASARTAADLGVSVDTVRKWQGRFAATRPGQAEARRDVLVRVSHPRGRPDQLADKCRQAKPVLGIDPGQEGIGAGFRR